MIMSNSNDSKNTVWAALSPEEYKKVFELGEQYKDFLNQAKTERECVEYINALAQAHGFVDINDVTELKPGNKIYSNYRRKNMAMIVIGKQDISHGLNIIASHLDSPRLDLKQNPLYESNDLALLKTHYYGGLKKYQWLAIPLSLHGVVFRRDGQKIDINIGEAADDPVFTITDLLPHLAKDQVSKKMNEAVAGEDLNVLIGSIALNDSQAKDKVKAGILDYLQKHYQIEEEDFISAELEVVPGLSAKDIGLDRSMIGAYGQDDRVCAFASIKALEAIDIPEKTCLVYFADKEEIGSTGNTGMSSHYLDNLVAELINLQNGSYNELFCRRALGNSRALSADVTGALDPNYESVMDKLNCSKLGFGISIDKYTGSRGKYDSSDCNAEYLSFIRSLYNNNNIVWQTGELGKVDQGGGGTVAYLLAAYGMDVVDCGVAVLGMHSPYEVTSKADIFMTVKAYNVFLMS